MLALVVILYLITFNSVKCLEYSWNSSHHSLKIPQEIMVEVVNDLALKLLAIHNEGNENNIALSPYGALSVLVALAEGVQGNALEEIQRASKIPPDLSIIRIGLRDIHRHLKSYFIPEEGFLSGLSLSHDNVTLNKNYEEIIRFYGFDIDSINNVVYPQLPTSTRPSINEDEKQTDSISTTTATPLEASTTTEHFLIIMTDKTDTSTINNDIDNTPTILPTLETTEKTNTIDTKDTTTPSHQTQTLVTTADNKISTEEEASEKITTLALTQTTTSTELPFTTTENEFTKIPSETTTFNLIDTTVVPEITNPALSTTENPVFVTEAVPTSTITEDRIEDDIIDMSTTTEEFNQETSTLTEISTTEPNTTPVSIEKFINRQKRSLVDYFIARYYDDNVIPKKPLPLYPENEKHFLINGNQKEPNANFMEYDTVLPYHYLPHLNTQVLRFPLDSSRYYLLLLLPEGKEDVNNLICDLRLNTNLKYIIDHLQYVHVKATIPSFTLKGLVVLTSTLQKMGVRKVFEPRQADFTPMTDDKRIYVTNIEQAITVNIRNYVDPITMKNSKRYLQQSEPIEFKVDHPFLYFVIDSEINVTLMAGKIVNPLNARIK